MNAQNNHSSYASLLSIVGRAVLHGLAMLGRIIKKIMDMGGSGSVCL